MSNALKTAGKAALVATGAVAIGYAVKRAWRAFDAYCDFGNLLVDRSEMPGNLKEMKKAKAATGGNGHADGSTYAVDHSEMPANIYGLPKSSKKKVINKPIVTIKQMQNLNEGILNRAYC